MNCERARRQASMRLDDDGVPSGEVLDRHLRCCEECRRFLEIALHVGTSYRSEVASRIEALRRLDRPRRRPPLVLAAALLLAAIFGGVLREKPVGEPPAKPAAVVASIPPAAIHHPRQLTFFDDPTIPWTLSAEGTSPAPADPEAPLSDWLRALPAKLAEEPLAPAVIPALPARFSEES